MSDDETENTLLRDELTIPLTRDSRNCPKIEMPNLRKTASGLLKVEAFCVALPSLGWICLGPMFECTNVRQLEEGF